MQPAHHVTSIDDLPASSGGGFARIVVGYDGSDSATAAAAFGLWLAGKLGAETTVIHATTTRESAPTADLLPAVAAQRIADEGRWRWRLESLREYAAPDAAVTCRVVPGNPAGALIAAAIETDAELILVGSHGVGRARAAFLGSVSSQVLFHAPCSVMVFRENGPSSPARHARAVVVGVDDSPSSRHALERAQALAVAGAARLVLVHAYDPHVPFVSQPSDALRDEVRSDARAVLHKARELITAPLDLVEQELVEGRADDALVAACERHAPALLVVGSRGRGGFKDLLLGSTSRWVANAAPCPVLVARRPVPSE